MCQREGVVYIPIGQYRGDRSKHLHLVHVRRFMRALRQEQSGLHERCDVRIGIERPKEVRGRRDQLCLLS
jgi:hypothetical protein